MKAYFPRYKIGMCVVLMVLSWSVGQAQTTETFTVAGVDHTLVYTAGNAGVDVVKQVLQDALPIYNNLFSMSTLSMRIQIYDVPAAGRSDLLADASPNSEATPDCVVQVYRNPASLDPAALRFTLAHEFSHCYQYETRSNPATVFARMPNDPNSWWIEGSAEWLASLVYPPVGDPIAGSIRDLFMISNVRIYDNDYEQFWFINFLAQNSGNGAVIDLIRNIPLTPAEQTAYLNAIMPARDLMGSYGFLMMNNSLTPQPPLTADKVESFPIRALPATQSLTTDRLSVKIVHLSLPTPSAGNGIAFSLAPDSDDTYKILWRDGTEISKTSGVELCGEAPSGIYVAVARGESSSEEPTYANLVMQEIPCEAVPVDIPDCLLGTWNMILMPGATPEATQDLTGSYFEFNADGSALLQINARVTTTGPNAGEPIILEMRLGFGGTLTFGQTAPGMYVVMGGSGSILPYKSLTMTINGNTQDLTSTIDRFLASSGMGIPSRTVFACSETSLVQTVFAGGVAVEYIYTR
jgi:hypothetical protein